MPSRLTVVLVSLLLATPVIIFWLWLVILSTSMEIQCPEKCRCEGDGYYVNCSGSGLNSIPSILPKHMRQLIFDGNNIPFLAKDNFVSKGLDELRIIRASFCKIKEIEVGAFNGLPKLTVLSMQSNEISEITPGTFETLCRLENLHLARNRIKHLEADIFNGLTNLKYIYLQGNRLQYLHPDTFFGLPNFQELFLSKNYGLQIPTVSHFMKSLSLKQLDISGCNIRSVSLETFANVSELEQLDLSYNYLSSVDINILKALPKLSHLNLKRNEIIQITPFTCVQLSPLEYLFLEYNKIEHLEIDVFSGFVNLKYIDLQGNKLQYLHPDTFVRLPNLKRLFLSKNSGLQIPNDRHFINSLSLKRLEISRCNISSVSVETFAKVASLELLDLSYNYLRSVDINILKVLPKLSHLSLESNEICEIIPGVIGNNSSLEYLDLDNNKIEQLEINVFYELVNLKDIYLQGNKLQYLHPDMFIRLPKLQKLYLSKNSGLQITTDRHFINSLSLIKLEISFCNINSVSVETFAKVASLEQLDLSYNYLKSLDINILKLLPKLSHLYLESNEINEIIPGIFGNNCLLEYLDLDNNKIEHLGIDVFYELVHLKYIYLLGNKLQYLHPETFIGLPKLHSLYLTINFGLQIPTDRHFITSNSLKHLAISGCNVNSVSVETFANVSALELLDLGENNLKSLDISILKALPQLSKLYLYGNPLQCDCQLQEVWRWCQDHNIQTAYNDIAPECGTPSEVGGLWWGVLEKGQCLQGNIQFYGEYNNTRYSYTQIEDTDTDTDTEKDTDTKTELNTESVIKKNIAIFLYHYKLPLSAILFTFGTTGNVILIIIITCNKDMRTVPNMYVLNVAISDIIYLTVLFCEALPGSVISLSGDIMCIFFSFCRRMSVILTAYSIAILSIQRYRVTVYPLHVWSSSQPTWRVTGATICGVWIVAALFAIPSVLTKDFCGSSVFVWITNYYQRVTIFYVLVFCVLPLCVIAFSYIMIFCHLLKSRFSLSETQNARHNTRKNTAKVVLGLTAVFLFSYLPSHIYEMFLVLSINFDKSDNEIVKEFEVVSNLAHILSVLDLFLCISSCLNPVALFCTSHAFRRHLKRYLTCCCKTNFHPNDFELTRRN